MNLRQITLKAIRPEVADWTITDVTSQDEQFQNLVLRPVIAVQSDLFVEVFKNYATKHKSVFYDLPLEKRIDYIENAIIKDMKFRNSLKGMVIGLFTVEEYLVYIKNSSALNKRMMHLVKEDLINNMQLFNAPILKAI
ncbi:MAG: glyoxalase [Flavobacteriaceae bacterium]